MPSVYDLGGTGTQVNVAGVPTKVTLLANTAQLIVAKYNTWRGVRILNYTASPLYLSFNASTTPTSDAASDYVPAAASGVPGQYESASRVGSGMQAISASAGDIMVEGL